jgi:hypothetical protein
MLFLCSMHIGGRLGVVCMKRLMTSYRLTFAVMLM